MKREQRYRQQFEEALAKASHAETLHLELESSKSELQTAKAREPELQAQINNLKVEAARNQRGCRSARWHDITTLLPKVSYGPDYQIRHQSTPSAPGFAREASDPYRAPRILQWIGSHPKQTLVAICPTIATAAADRYFLYQPSYRELIDAPVKQLLSPVTGTVLVAGGEPSMSVAKGQPLFTIKNANDGREQVRDAKEQTVALEEEIKYLETVRASLLQRQITQGITNPSDWISKPALPLTEKWATQNTDLPDRPVASHNRPVTSHTRPSASQNCPVRFRNRPFGHATGPATTSAPTVQTHLSPGQRPGFPGTHP